MYSKLRVLMAMHDPPLTQAALIEKTGLGSNTISKLANNTFSRVDRQTVDTLIGFFDCEIGDLCGVKEVTDDA